MLQVVLTICRSAQSLQAKDTFRALDTNGDGVVSLQEVQKAPLALECEWSELLAGPFGHEVCRAVGSDFDERMSWLKSVVMSNWRVQLCQPHGLGS